MALHARNIQQMIRHEHAAKNLQLVNNYNENKVITYSSSFLIAA
jgi:hypothetical protein